ncbi:MAG: hypothetical protein WC343_07035 [Bacilli bacterium]
MKPTFEPPCIEYAKLNGPVDEDEMAWGFNLAKFFKSRGFTVEKAAMHLSRLALNGDQDEPIDDDSILEICKLAWASDVELTCTELMGSVSFLRGCTQDKCPEFVAPVVPVGDGPTAKRVSLLDPPGSVGIDSDGRVKVVKQFARGEETRTVLEWISDCQTYIHTETIADNEREFIFEGTGAKDKLRVRFSMPAEDLADNKKFKSALINAFGAANRVGSLTFEIVQQITQKTIKKRRLCAPAWVDGKPMIPGADTDDIEFKLLSMVPAQVHDGDFALAMATLEKLLDIPGPTMILVTAIMGSPIYARWFPNDRFGIGMWGRTGSMKTSVTKKAMCVYGEGYNDDINLLKHGEDDGTAFGKMEVLAGAGILPQILDNVKSVNPRDVQRYIAIIHAVIEGKGKIQGKKDGGLRKNKTFYCTPIVTGEIKPEEASTTARILNLKWVEPKNKEEVDFVQRNVMHLPVIGYNWLKFLSGVKDPSIGFDEARSRKTDEFNQSNYVNSGRLATIYALLRATWNLLCVSPFGEAFKPRTEAFLKELDAACMEQGKMVSEETEVAKFISGIIAILSTQPHLIQDSEHQKPDEYGKSMYKDVIGRWVDSKENTEERDLFLVPAPTLAALKRLGIFTQIPGEGSMTDALVQAGYLITQEKRKKTQYRLNGKRPWGWMIKASVVNPPEPTEVQSELSEAALKSLKSI